MSKKIASMSSSTVSKLHAKYSTIPCNRNWNKLSQEFWEKRNSSAPYRTMYTQIVSLLFLLIYIMYIKFYLLKIEISLFKKFREKCYFSATYWAIFTKSWYTLIYVWITINMKFYEFLFISSWVTLSTTFLLHTHRQIGIFKNYSIRLQDILKRINQSKIEIQKFLWN